MWETLQNNADWDCFKTPILQEILKTQNLTSGATLCVFGSHAFVPKSWMCKKQTSVSHSSTESEIISLDAGLRLDGIPALDLWDLIVLVLGSVSQTSDRTGRPVNIERRAVSFLLQVRPFPRVVLLLRFHQEVHTQRSLKVAFAVFFNARTTMTKPFYPTPWLVPSAVCDEGLVFLINHRSRPWCCFFSETGSKVWARALFASVAQKQDLPCPSAGRDKTSSSELVVELGIMRSIWVTQRYGDACLVHEGWNVTLDSASSFWSGAVLASWMEMGKWALKLWSS